MDLDKLVQLYVDARDLEGFDVAVAVSTIHDFIRFLRTPGYFLTSGYHRN